MDATAAMLCSLPCVQGRAGVGCSERRSRSASGMTGYYREMGYTRPQPFSTARRGEQIAASFQLFLADPQGQLAIRQFRPQWCVHRNALR